MASKFALVIANTEYQDASFAKLTAPGKDAEEFAQVLRELAAFDDVQVFLNGGEGQTRRAIARFFINRKRDDLLLLYFSGHGVRNEQGQLFLAANDTEIGILEASGIPAEFVTNSMNNSRSQRQLLILDCCNSGAFAHGSKSASGVGKSMGIATAFEGSGFGRVVLTATDATQYAWEGDKVIGNTQKSVFTHFLIEGLKGEADRDGDGRIHVDELYDYAYEQIVTRTPKQTPGKWSYKQQGDLVLRENLKPREIKPAPLPPELLEMLAHPNSGVRRAGLQELIGLLDGKHQGLARAAQDKLREIAENDDSLTIRRTANETLVQHGLTMDEPKVVEFSHQGSAEASILFPIENATRPEEYSVNAEAVTRVKVNDSKLVQNVAKPEVAKTSNRSEKKIIISNYNYRLLGAIISGVLVLVLLFWGGSYLVSQQNAKALEKTETSRPALTLTPSLTSTVTPTITATFPPPLTGREGMTLLYVPAGEYTMGNSNGDIDENPEHVIFLDSFWIDETEITNLMYSLCVNDGVCRPPTSKGSNRHSEYYENEFYDNYPVIYVDWGMADTYCKWAGRRLPTESEWEKAARGVDGRVFPWGNFTENIGDLTNYSPNRTISNLGQSTKVGNYPDGASPYGALDMAGNVWEWVADWYDEAYYENSPLINPLGPVSGEYKIIRGGGWSSSLAFLSSVNRFTVLPDKVGNDLGFRCVMDATP